MAEKVYFGVPGNIQEIPAPKSGMAFLSNVDYEETELVSGGRSIYRAPTAYKTFNMTWGSSSDRLRHLIDLYNGQFGPGPFYITDPTAHSENVLPSRWANSWQLAHQANGWCRPVVNTETAPTAPMPTVARTNRAVVFKQAASGASVKTSGVVRTRLIRVPGKPYFLSAAGSATGGAGIYYRTYSNSTNAWSAPTLFSTLTGSATQIVTAGDTTTTMIELDLYLPLGSTLTLRGMALGTVDHSVIQNVLRTNLATNPSFEAASGTATVRTNAALNPRAAVDTATWTSITGGAPGTTSFTRVTESLGSGANAFSTTATDLNSFGDASGAYFEVPAAPNDVWSVGVVARFVAAAPANIVGRLGLEFRSASAALAFHSNNITNTTTTATSLKVENRTAPAGTTLVRIYVHAVCNSATTAAAVDLRFTDVVLEKTPLVGTYFDGATPAAGDFVYSWVGGAHGSSSNQTGTGVANTSGSFSAAIQSSSWANNATKSVRVIPTGTSTDTFAGISGVTLVTGKTYTVSATLRLAAAQTAAGSAARQIRVYHSNVSAISTTATNAAGEYRVSVTFTVTDGAAYQSIRLYNGASFGGGEVWWDSLLIEEAPDSGSYFDGNTSDSTSQDRYYRWTGLVNASSSIVTDQIPTDWMASGRGVGPVQFSGAADGELVSSTIDRIGLSLDFTEVQNVESPML